MPVERMRMRPWLEEQINSNTIPGLKWLNKVSTMGVCVCLSVCVFLIKHVHVDLKIQLLCVQNLPLVNSPSSPKSQPSQSDCKKVIIIKIFIVISDHSLPLTHGFSSPLVFWMTVYGKILAVFFLPSPFSLNSLLAPPGFVGLEDVGTLGSGEWSI